MLRSRIRFVRYIQATKKHATKQESNKSQTFNLFQQNPHPVTLGPEQISRFFTYVANSERSRFWNYSYKWIVSSAQYGRFYHNNYHNNDQSNESDNKLIRHTLIVLLYTDFLFT